MKLLCGPTNLTWEHVNDIPSRPLTSITKVPEYAVTRNFKNFIQPDMDLRHCLSPYCFIDQIITSCMGIIIKDLRFTFALREIGGGASLALLHKGMKFLCASSTYTGTRFFESCYHSSEGFIEWIQRCHVERGVRHLQFTIQRPGDLISFHHLLAHVVLTLDAGSPTNLSG